MAKKFDIITIFPEALTSYFSASIIGRAQKEKIIEIGVHNLRDWADDKHKSVDDTPYGGGAGMVLKVEPIQKAVESVKSKGESRTILFSAKGKRFTQSDAERLKEYDQLVLICGRYEGVDERVAENIADEEISIGDYVLTGGEVPAMVLIDSVTRLIPGVLGNPESLDEESHNDDSVEYPQYTKPEDFSGWKVPEILLSGDHGKIAKWRKENSKN